MRRAEAYTEMGLTDRARDDLLQAMALLPDRSQLSAAESLYVDAVAATLGRNFRTAIDKYALIADSVGDADKAAAHVDLGRAYENNEDLDRAIDSYVKATQLDPQAAAAFLRAGILHGRRQQLSQANEAFSKAEEIYRAMSSQEGLAEVHYQRGSLLARIRRLPEARVQLEQSLAMSRASSSEYQAIRTSLQLSNVYYATGDSNRAKAIAADAVKAAQRLNSRTLATNGLIDLGIHAAGAGRVRRHARVPAAGARSGPAGQVASPGSAGPPRAWQSEYAGGQLRRGRASPRGGAEVLPAGGLPHRDVQRPDSAGAGVCATRASTRSP